MLDILIYRFVYKNFYNIRCDFSNDNYDKKKLLEMFGAGTACVVCPIDGILYKGEKLSVPTMTKGATIMNRISKELNDIHYGRTNSKWSVPVE